MIVVLLDTNIYDMLEKHPDASEQVRNLVMLGVMKVLVSRTVAEELHASPFKGIPDFFPCEYVGNTVGRVGIMCAGDSIGNGNVFYRHQGNSTKRNDALIADAASWYADWLVSEDTRMRKRANEQQLRCKAIDFLEFAELLRLAKAASPLPL